MPPAYTAQQKSAIANFQSFTQADKNTAVKFLKNNNWNQDAAANAFYAGGGGAAAPTGSQSALKKLFDKYRDNPKSSPDTIEADGALKYIQDLGADLEDLDSLAVMEVVQAPGMAEISRDGFVKGWSDLNCDTIDKQKAYLQNLKQVLPSSIDGFTKIYNYTFLMNKTEQQKAIGLDVASAFWTLLFSSKLSAVKWSTPNSPWLDWWLEFMSSEFKKSVNKDTWTQTLKFAKESLEDEALTFWNEEESAWPGVIDDFIIWVKKEKRGGEGEAMEE